MIYLLDLLSGLTGVYMLLIFIRILLTWFPGADFGRPLAFLRAICDPYLAWFRRFRIFKNSPLDFSPLLALAALSLLRGILGAWRAMGRISLAVILAFFLQALWSILSWVLGFFIVILILRLVCYLSGGNIYSPFWRLVDYIAQPVMYRVGRIFFPRRIVNYLFRIIFSIMILAATAAGAWFLIRLGVFLLGFLPF
jgi:YggT family protein